MTKILEIISTYAYPVKAGQELSTIRVYSNLIGQGWAVNIHASNQSPNGKQVFKSEENIQGIVIHRYPLYYFATYLFGSKIKNNSDTVVVLKDLIIFPGIIFLALVWIKKILGIKKFTVIFSSHGLFSYNENHYPGLKMKLKKVIDRTFGVWLVNSAVDAVRAISNKERYGLVSAGINPELISVIYNGLENMAFESNIDDKASEQVKHLVAGLGDYMIQMSRLDRVKNHKKVIEAMPKLNSKIKFVLMGSDHDVLYKDELLNLARSLKIEDRIVFIGSKEAADKYYLIRKAKFNISLSLSEAFGNSINEAMSQGQVCIVSQDTGMSEYLVDKVNGFVVDPNNVNEIANTINYVLDEKNKIEIDQIKNNNLTRKYKKWNEVSMELEEFYLNPLSTSPKNMKYNIQVEPNHYFNSHYENQERFISYYDQKNKIFEVLNKIPNGKVLEIGKGNGFLSDYLIKNGVNIKTFDIDSRLKPDYCGDLTSANKIVTEHFDLIVCYEVLEHIKFEDLDNAISNFKQMNPQYMIISVPQLYLHFAFWFRVNILGVFQKNLQVPFPLKHVFNGEHHWELGKKGFGLRKFRAVINKYFKIEKEFTNPLNNHHRFFVIKNPDYTK